MSPRQREEVPYDEGEYEEFFVPGNGRLGVLKGVGGSGKTTTLARLGRTAESRGLRVLYVVSAHKTGGVNLMRSRDDLESREAVAAKTLLEVQEGCEMRNYDLVLVDEGWMWNDLPLVQDWAFELKVNAVVGSIAMDYLGRVSQSVAMLCGVANLVKTFHCKCHECGGLACYDHRISSVEDLFEEDVNSYVPLCATCFYRKPGKSHGATLRCFLFEPPHPLERKSRDLPCLPRRPRLLRRSIDAQQSPERASRASRNERCKNLWRGFWSTSLLWDRRTYPVASPKLPKPKATLSNVKK